MKRIWRIAPLVVGITLAGLVAVTLWEAVRAYRKASREVTSSFTFNIHSTALDLHPVPGVESIGAPGHWRDVAGYKGHLFIASSNALIEYDGAGKLLRRFRIGLELPAAPLTNLATGTLADARESELLIATGGEGLLAYNGVVFRQLRAEEASARNITALLPLKTGRVLLGTDKAGLLVYDGAHLTEFHEQLRGLHVSAIAGDASDVWIGTLDRGAYHWHAGQLAALDEVQGLPDQQIVSLAVRDQAAFIGTPAGIAEIADGKVKRILARGAFARTISVTADSLLVGTMDEGLLQVPLIAGRLASLRPGGAAGQQEISKVTVIDGQTYALGPAGLASGNSHGGWTTVLARDESTLADANVSSLAIGGDGKLWVGYFDRGIDVLDLQSERSRHVEDAHVFCVNRIAFSPDGNYALVATANGLAVMDRSGNLEQVLTKDDGLIASHVNDIAFIPEKAGQHKGLLPAMAIATPAGITFLDSSGMRSLYAFHGLANNHVYAIGADGERVVAGTLGGVSVLESGIVRASFNTSNSALQHNWVTALVKVGADWFVGTYGAGVMRFNGARWESFADLAALGPDMVINPNAMLVTTDRVYAGTLGRGLWIYDRGNDRWSARTSGLPSLNVTALAERNGQLYIGTDNGLVRVTE